MIYFWSMVKLCCQKGNQRYCRKESVIKGANMLQAIITTGCKWSLQVLKWRQNPRLLSYLYIWIDSMLLVWTLLQYYDCMNLEKFSIFEISSRSLILMEDLLQPSKSWYLTFEKQHISFLENVYTKLLRSLQREYYKEQSHLKNTISNFYAWHG